MSEIARDLFGEPIAAATAFRKDGQERKIGYAARPGTGPKGQRCNTCAHCMVVVYHGMRSRKCHVVAALWSASPATDIKHNAPACREWQRKPYKRDE